MARPLVLCGPSGAGKSTIIKLLTNEFPNSFGFSVSHTTRMPRPGESDGVHYNFIERESMAKAIANGEFIESAEFSGNLYGTSKKAVQKVLEDGRICILDIDMQGVMQIKVIPSLNPHYVFIKPPSLEILEDRLRQRKTETEESLKKRMEAARKEIEYGEIPGNFDLVITNDNLEEAYQKLRQFILPEIRNQQKLFQNGNSH